MTRKIKILVKPEVYNNTAFGPERIAELAELGRTVNKWRGRNITLLVHPTAPDRLISVGTTFDGRMTVICDDARTEWTTALEHAASGKVYVSE